MTKVWQIFPILLKKKAFFMKDTQKKHLIDNPLLMSEWNYEKNGDLRPEHFTANSGKKVWWICEKGHEWQATIYDRNNGRGCPECKKLKKKK